MKRFLVVLLFLGAATSSSLAAASGATVTYIYTDGQGSPVAEADSAGNITATYDYTPFGSTLLGTQKNGPGYTGHVSDPDTSLTYMQARYYDPSMGQFLSVDPVTTVAGQVASFSAYTYADNNPTTKTDPDGRWTEQKGLDYMGYISHFVPPKDGEGASGGSTTGSTSSPSGGSNTPRASAKNGPGKAGEAEKRSGFSFDGLLAKKPSVWASGVAAYGGGVEVDKGLYKSDDKISVLTPALGLSASVDTKLISIVYNGSNAQEAPISMTAGGTFDFHYFGGGRVSFGYRPPSTFELELDVGVGMGVEGHVFSVDGNIKQ